MGYLPIGQIPKYLQSRFNKPNTTIKPEHEKFVKGIINEFTENEECIETGAKYDSEINQGYRAFKKDKSIFIVIEPYYYVVKID